MKKILGLSLLGISLYASATLCYKQNWNDITKIEQIPLNGGECNGIKSVKQMKSEGWHIKDIQMQKVKKGYNFTYIFEKNINNTASPTAISITKENLRAQLKQIQKEEAKKTKIEKLKEDLKIGEKIYKSKCEECHGVNGELSPYNNSRKLNEMSLDELRTAIRDYGLNQKDNGTAFVMQPYLVVEEDIEKIYKYLQSMK